MKGSERARALCDKKHLAEKLNKIEDVFVANGYPRETVKILPQRDREKIYGRKTSTSDRQKRTGRTGKSWNRDHPYLKGLSEQFRRTANRHSFRGALKPGRNIKEIKRTCQEPHGERQKYVVYKIPCACQNTVYVGETWRLFQTRKKENINKVRLTYK